MYAFRHVSLQCMTCVSFVVSNLYMCHSRWMDFDYIWYCSWYITLHEGINTFFVYWTKYSLDWKMSLSGIVAFHKMNIFSYVGFLHVLFLSTNCHMKVDFMNWCTQTIPIFVDILCIFPTVFVHPTPHLESSIVPFFFLWPHFFEPWCLLHFIPLIPSNPLAAGVLHCLTACPVASDW
jgi:hypothetical protein